MYDPESLAVLTLTISCIWSVLCRINQMGKETPHYVFFKYSSLALGLFVGWVLPDHRDLAVVLGIAGYLLISAPQWKNGTPTAMRKKTQDAQPKQPGLWVRAWEWILHH